MTVLCNNFRPLNQAIVEFEHWPQTNISHKRTICKLDKDVDPGPNGHLIPLKNVFGLWLVLVGGNLKKSWIYHCSDSYEPFHEFEFRVDQILFVL